MPAEMLISLSSVDFFFTCLIWLYQSICTEFMNVTYFSFLIIVEYRRPFTYKRLYDIHMPFTVCAFFVYFIISPSTSSIFGKKKRQKAGVFIITSIALLHNPRGKWPGLPCPWETNVVINDFAFQKEMRRSRKLPNRIRAPSRYRLFEGTRLIITYNERNWYFSFWELIHPPLFFPFAKSQLFSPCLTIKSSDYLSFGKSINYKKGREREKKRKNAHK